MVRCYLCNSPSHKRHECPSLSKPPAGVCATCRCFHPANVACFARGNTGVYAAATNNDMNEHVSECGAAIQNNFLLPIVINGCNVLAMRDTGCQIPMIVQPRYVHENDYTGRNFSCRGAFDEKSVSHRVPIARVRLFAPCLNCVEPTEIEVGVWPLPEEIDCLLGNALFAPNSQLSDIVGKGPRENLSQDFRVPNNRCSAAQVPGSVSGKGHKSPVRNTDRHRQLFDKAGNGKLDDQQTDRPAADSGDTVTGDQRSGRDVGVANLPVEYPGELHTPGERATSTIGDTIDSIKSAGQGGGETVTQRDLSDTEKCDNAAATGHWANYDGRTTGGAVKGLSLIHI